MKIGGGVSTVRQYLQAGLVDAMHLAFAPVVSEAANALPRSQLPELGFSVTEHSYGKRGCAHCAGEKELKASQWDMKWGFDASRFVSALSATLTESFFFRPARRA